MSPDPQPDLPAPIVPTPLDSNCYCPECGYPLVGLFAPGTCPECSRRYFTPNRWHPVPIPGAADNIAHFCTPTIFNLVCLVAILLNGIFFHYLIIPVSAACILVFSIPLGVVRPWTASASWMRDYIPPGRRNGGVFATLSQYSPSAAYAFAFSWISLPLAIFFPGLCTYNAYLTLP